MQASRKRVEISLEDEGYGLSRLTDVDQDIAMPGRTWQDHRDRATLAQSRRRLPLVAAVAPNIISFNPEAGTLTLRRQPGFITFYPDKVMITQVKDTDEGLQLLSAVRDLLNQCWDQRDTIQPVTTMRRAPRPLDVWTLLPQTNCKRCGEATCMAFAFLTITTKARC